MPYPLLNALFDDLVPPGLHHYWKGAFSYGLTDGVVDALVAYGATTPSVQSVTVVFPVDGACHRVRPEDTAFSYRDADDHDRLQANYRGNLARLTELKRRHDPGNLFRLNHNIAP